MKELVIPRYWKLHSQISQLLGTKKYISVLMSKKELEKTFTLELAKIANKSVPIYRHNNLVRIKPGMVVFINGVEIEYAEIFNRIFEEQFSDSLIADIERALEKICESILEIIKNHKKYEKRVQKIWERFKKTKIYEISQLSPLV